MADNPVLENDGAAPAKRKGVKRRAFLIGGAALVGGGLFALKIADSAALKKAIASTTGAHEASFLAWIKIGADDVVTLYSPHIDFGQGSHTGLAQMLAEELDADWSKIKVEQAPPEGGFANTALGRYFMGEMGGMPALANAMPTSWVSMMARSMPVQLTGGSSAMRATGQHGFRVIGAATRLALIEEAASRIGVPAAELTTEKGHVVHAKSGQALRYGALAEGAAGRTLTSEPKLKDRKNYQFIGKPVPRIDIPSKVDGTARYTIDVAVPDMRVATIMMAPVRDGKLEAVDEKPALAVAGVEKVIKLDEAVVVIAKGYWQATKGLQALAPKFTDGGHGTLSSSSIFAAQDALNNAGKPLAAPADGKSLTGAYKAPFLHQAMMEPFAMVAQYKDGKLEAWGGLQDPLSTRMKLAAAANISVDAVTFHPMIMGGGFGRRFPDYCQIIDQIAKIALQVPYPVKLIWSREEEVKHGAYRPQVAARLQASLGKDGKILAWASDYAQKDDAAREGTVPYTIPEFEARHHDYISNQVNAFWRSVNASQHGFFNESFVDELAHAAGQDPYQFRHAHLPAGSRHLAVLDAVAKQSGWGTSLPAGVGRGIALVESFGTIVAEVVEASLKDDGTPKVHKVSAVVDCGTTVNPRNGEAQIMGGIIMGLSSAIGEEITLEKGAVVQSSFPDYPVMKLADSPPVIDVQFIESDAPMGGLGEPGVPPAAPALANALFAITGQRVRQLPIKAQANAALVKLG
jgi:isoquinoline 1-oxidoreductase subunit beta